MATDLADDDKKRTTRRDVFGLLGAAAYFVTRGAVAQQVAGKMYRLGVLSPSAGSIERFRPILFPELAKLGFSEGQNLAVEVRVGATEQLPALAQELVMSRPEVVVAVTAAAI